jgi:hypothetical protein
MNHSVLRLLRHDLLRSARWLIFVAPLVLSGCFESQSQSQISAKSSGFGIQMIGRFFRSGNAAPEKKPESAGNESAAFKATSFSFPTDIESSLSNLDVAIPAHIGSERRVVENPFSARKPSPPQMGIAKSGPAAGFGPTADFVFNTPFNLLFASIFKSNKSEHASLINEEELPNPFTEAKQKQDSETASKSAATAKEPERTGNTETADSNGTVSQAGGGAPIYERFLVIGDLDGSGVLSSVEAKRTGDTSFAGQDGVRTFSLFVNTAAAEQHRAFYIEDINGDLIPDLLVTAHESLFGSILTGNGKGGYQFAGRFLTGYEPMIPCAGPFQGGERQILTVNTRSGILATLSPTDRFHPAQSEKLAFVPNYLLHLVNPDTSAEFLRTALGDRAEQILQWEQNGHLETTGEKLETNPMIFSSGLGSSTVQVYQVGNYASVVLTTGQGQSFNVANFHIYPGKFLVIGDFQRTGSVDVAIADLQTFTPAK